MSILLPLVAAAIIALTAAAHGRRAWPLCAVLAVVGVLAPVQSIITFGADSFDRVAFLGIVFVLALGLTSMVGFRGTRSRFSEFAKNDSFPLRALLVSVLVIAIGSQVVMLQRLGSAFQFSDLYELNVAYSRPDIPSFGIWGRLNRLAMPFGLFSMVLALAVPKGRRRAFYGALALAFIVALLGPRRSLVFYQVCSYGLAFLISRVQRDRLGLRPVLWLGLGVAALQFFFGYVQIATRKSAETSAWASGVREGSLYVAGNLPYSQCVSGSRTVVDSWSGFPGIEKLIDPTATAGSKPFCSLPGGTLFNTSPGYVDVSFDLGLLAVLAFGLVLGGFYCLVSNARNSSLGMQALVLTGICFQFRENLYGQWDYLQEIVVYALIWTYCSAKARQTPLERQELVDA